MKRLLQPFLFLLAFSVVFLPLESFAQYCLPYYYYPCSSGDLINDVKFGAINHVNTGCNGAAPNNYTDFSPSLGATVTPGMYYTIQVKPGSWDEYIGAYFDFNRDGDFFDAGEFLNMGLAPGNTTITSTVTIPITASTGVTRMRIVAKYGYFANANDACNPLMYYGETQDYRLTINPIPAQDGGVSSVTSPITGCGLTNAEIVRVRIRNRGTASISNFNVCYKINALANVCQLVTSTILPGDSLLFSFATPANLSVYGTYTFNFWTTVLGDGNTQNDSLKNYIVTNVASVSTIPYAQKFDATNG